MIFLGIGSNLPSSFGNRLDNINSSIKLLKKNKIEVLKISSFYESIAFPNKNDPKFLNIVVETKTLLQPKDLMITLMKIEEILERKRLKKNAPRTCDIDIIDYKRKIINLELHNQQLQIPHRSLSDRNFVLYPLKEISPNWSHPLGNVSIDILISKLKNKNNGITKLSQSDINEYVE
tara:strand:+ start:647 stop:1177 length:531 start_codon:yes stop_codon:yes gene_type:complete